MNFYKSLQILCCFLITIELISQSQLQKKKVDEQYSRDNTSQEQRNEYYFGSKPIAQSTVKYHFRYMKYGQILDVKSVDGAEFTGQLINEIVESKLIKTGNGNTMEPSNYVFEIVSLKKENAAAIGRLILNDTVYKIPTDTLISNWNVNWLHCGRIRLHYKIDDSITYSSYTCLANQSDTIPEVREIKRIEQKLYEIFKLDKKYDEFCTRLEKGKFYSKDGYTHMYLIPEREIENRKKSKPIRAYQKTIKDTIDHYLEFKLNQLIPKAVALDCYDTYRLAFNKKGGIKQMKVDMGFWERLFDKDYKKCRQTLKKALKEIKIDFIDPKYPFNRNVYFSNDGVYIKDPTIY